MKSNIDLIEQLKLMKAENIAVIRAASSDEVSALLNAYREAHHVAADNGDQMAISLIKEKIAQVEEAIGRSSPIERFGIDLDSRTISEAPADLSR